MRIKIAAALSMMLLAVAASSAELPAQKPGLWRMTVKSASMPGGSRSFEICEDAAFIAAAKASSDARLKKDCTAASSLPKVGDTWVADAECTMSGIHIVNHSVTTIHGDALYHTEATSITGSPKGAKKTDVMTMDNQWLGACKAGQRVGAPTAG